MLQVHSHCCTWHYFILCNVWVIFHCVCVQWNPYPFLCQWTFRLLPCLGYCKQCRNEHWDICILLDHVFYLDICPRVRLQGHMIALLLALWGTSLLISIVAVSIYIPTNSIGELPFLQHLFFVRCFFVFCFVFVVVVVVVVVVFDNHSGWYEVIFHCSLDFSFSNT